MKKSAIVAAALLLRCHTLPPELLPPPFGPDGPKPPRLFFPTGLAVASNGLLVANGNFNRAFEAGTVVQISGDYIDSLLKSTIDCDVDPATLDQATKDACYPQIPPAEFIGSGADGAGNRLAFGSRTTDNSFMQGECWTSQRLARRGAWTHL